MVIYALFRPTSPVARVPKKKKLKINIHRPIGTRVVFDDEGNTLPPLAAIANTTKAGDKVKLDPGKYCFFLRAQVTCAVREGIQKSDILLNIYFGMFWQIRNRNITTR